MKIILKEKIKKLGLIGDVAYVKAGYARNYLIPFGKAVLATESNIVELKKQKSDLEKAENERLLQAKKDAEIIRGNLIVIKSPSGDGGKLFGSVGSKDISKSIFEITGLKIAKRNIRIPNNTIKTLGKFNFSVSLHSNVQVECSLSIESL